MRPRIVLSSVLAAAALSLSGVACSADSDKSGGDAPTTTLKLATMEGRGAPYADSVEEFARQVEQLSDGSLRLQIIWNGAEEFLGEFGPRAEQDVAGLVQSGKLAAALIPARGWDELGVTSLQALQAPFLVSTEELVEQIVQGEPAEEMLAGLDKAGVVGLALLPEGLRHPVGFARPLLTLEDFAGAKIRAPLSNASYRLLEALAAKPVDICCRDFLPAVAGGEIDGADSDFAWGRDLPRPGTFTANVTFYPKVNAIVVNDDTFGDLSEEHREVLREAAAKTLSHALRNAPVRTAPAPSLLRKRRQDRIRIRSRRCGTRAGGRAGLRGAGGGPADQGAHRTVQADEGGLRRRPRPAAGGMRGDEQRNPLTTTGPAPSEFPEGVYRVERSAEYLIEKGMPPQTAHELAGLVTLTFENNRWRDHREGSQKKIASACTRSKRAESRSARTVPSAGSPQERSS